MSEITMWAICFHDNQPIIYREIYPHRTRMMKLFTTKRAAEAEHKQMQGHHGYEAGYSVCRVSVTPHTGEASND